MDIKEESTTTPLDDEVAALEEQRQPLLEPQQPQTPSEKPKKTPQQKAIRKTFKISAHLSNLLPTGSVLTYQILSPAFTHEGKCHSPLSQTLTLTLIGLCAFSCFFLCLTDSLRDERGKVRYGVATFRGLWVVDGSVTVTPEVAERYRLKFVDFIHAFLSMVVFFAVVLFDQNVVKCFYPRPSEEAAEMLTTLPIAVGVACSLLFVAFPSQRHGIGFPLSHT